MLFPYFRWRTVCTDGPKAAQWRKHRSTDPSIGIRKRRGRSRRQPQGRNWESRTEKQEKTCPWQTIVGPGQITLWAMLVHAHSPQPFLCDKMREEKDITYRKKHWNNHRTKPWCETHFLLLPSYFTSKRILRLRGLTQVNWPLTRKYF